MAKHEPLFGALFGKKEKDSSILTPKMQKELAQQKADKERQVEISTLLTDVRITLKALSSKYEDIFDSELLKARRNANNGVRDAGNYARIGVAYYSKQVVSAAQRRLEDMTSSFEISSSIDELTSTLKLVNELPKIIGKVSVSELGRAAKKMDQAAGSSGTDLASALSQLSGMKLNEADLKNVSDLVSSEEIEKWISDEDYAEECFARGSAKALSGEEVLKLVSPKKDRQTETVAEAVHSSIPGRMQEEEVKIPATSSLELLRKMTENL